MDHDAKDAHHGSTATVKLNRTLGELCLLIKGVSSKVNGTIVEVTHKIARISAIGIVLHHNNLKEFNEGEIWVNPSWGVVSGPDMAAKPLG